MGSFSPERVGWSAAPEINEGAARRKEVCDELIARIQSGDLEDNYVWALGQINTLSLFIEALSQRGNKKEELAEIAKSKQELREKIVAFNYARQKEETIQVLEEQREVDLQVRKGAIVDGFVELYTLVLNLGVDIGLLAIQYGGNYTPSKAERGAGTPTFIKMS